MCLSGLAALCRTGPGLGHRVSCSRSGPEAQDPSPQGPVSPTQLSVAWQRPRWIGRPMARVAKLKQATLRGMGNYDRIQAQASPTRVSLSVALRVLPPSHRLSRGVASLSAFWGSLLRRPSSSVPSSAPAQRGGCGAQFGAALCYSARLVSLSAALGTSGASTWRGSVVVRVIVGYLDRAPVASPAAAILPQRLPTWRQTQRMRLIRSSARRAVDTAHTGRRLSCSSRRRGSGLRDVSSEPSPPPFRLSGVVPLRLSRLSAS